MSIHYVQSMCTAGKEWTVWDITEDFTEIWGTSPVSEEEQKRPR